MELMEMSYNYLGNSAIFAAYFIRTGLRSKTFFFLASETNTCKYLDHSGTVRPHHISTPEITSFFWKYLDIAACKEWIFKQFFRFLLTKDSLPKSKNVRRVLHFVCEFKQRNRHMFSWQDKLCSVFFSRPGLLFHYSISRPVNSDCVNVDKPGRWKLKMCW